MLINDNGRALLSDFGLATAKQDGPTGLSTSKGFRGSFRYSSPEALDLGQVECPSDIWSWGCLAQEVSGTSLMISVRDTRTGTESRSGIDNDGQGSLLRISKRSDSNSVDM